MTEPKVVAATLYSKGGGGEYPTRYVVLEWDRGESAHKYSRHMQVKDGKHPHYYIYGHYYHTYADALADLKRSMHKDQMEYPRGNPSYCPGMDFER